MFEPSFAAELSLPTEPDECFCRLLGNGACVCAFDLVRLAIQFDFFVSL